MTSDERGRSELDPALERVYRRGHQIRFRKKLARVVSSATVGALLLSGAVLGIVKVGDRQAQQPNVAILPGSPGPASVSPPAVGTSSPSHHASPKATSASVAPRLPRCHNSTEKSCGTFYWITPPGSDAPVRVSIAVTTANPTAGQPVTFVVTVSDADAPNIRAWDTPNWGDHSSAVIGFALCLGQGYGPWSPPQKRSGSDQFTYTHTYESAGTYRFVIGGASDSGPPWHDRCVHADPYGGEGSAFHDVVVGPAEDPSPTPSSS